MFPCMCCGKTVCADFELFCSLDCEEIYDITNDPANKRLDLDECPDERIELARQEMMMHGCM